MGAISKNLVKISCCSTPVTKIKSKTQISKLHSCVLNARSVCNKPSEIYELLLDNSLDVLFVTETWLKPDGNGTVIHDMLPHCYSIICQTLSASQRGGGIAIIHRNNVRVDLVSVNATVLTSAEILECKVHIHQDLIHDMCIYRPPNKSSAQLLEEFEEILSIRFSNTNHLLVVGDINIHLDLKDNMYAKSLNEVFSVFSMNQIANEPTH